MIYNYKEKKAVVVLLSSIDTLVALNVVWHLSLALWLISPKDILWRECLVDKSWSKHLWICKYPVIITKAKQWQLRNTINQARENNKITMIDYPEEMLHTAHDDELNEAISNIEEEKINYLWAIFFWEFEEVNNLTKKFSLRK